MSLPVRTLLLPPSPLFPLPPLYCPFPSVVNRNVHAAHQHSLYWACKYDLAKGEAGLRHFEAARYAWLAARCYPTASPEELQLATEWNIWLFVHDDECDGRNIGRRPEELAIFHEKAHAIVCGEDLPTGGGHILEALYDLMQRTARMGSPAWRQRFLRNMDDYFGALRWEAENRAAHRMPNVADYLCMRSRTGAAALDIDLIELCEGIHLPAEVLDHPDIRRLHAAARNAVCWANDIVSLEKEARCNELHNLALVLQQEHECSLKEAAEQAAAMHDEEMRIFISLTQQLPSFNQITDAVLQRHLIVLRAWMRGCLDWAGQSARYGVALFGG